METTLSVSNLELALPKKREKGEGEAGGKYSESRPRGGNEGDASEASKEAVRSTQGRSSTLLRSLFHLL